jgi:hypothetical protein
VINQETHQMYKPLLSSIAMIAVLTGAYSSTASAQEQWGDLTVKFVLDGPVPKPEPIKAEKDPEVCNKNPLFSEEVVAGEKGELANVVVYVRTKKPKIHPDYNKLKQNSIAIDNKNCRFEPHIQVYWTEQKLEVTNSDPVGHNSNFAPFANQAQNVLIAAEQKQAITAFQQEEGVPVPVSCNIHPWMKAYLIVRTDPYAAVSNDKGELNLKNLPAGTELEFQVWHEKGGNVKNVSFKGGKTDTKGRFKMKLKPGSNDLGTIKVKLK